MTVCNFNTDKYRTICRTIYETSLFKFSVFYFMHSYQNCKCNLSNNPACIREASKQTSDRLEVTGALE